MSFEKKDTRGGEGGEGGEGGKGGVGGRGRGRKIRGKYRLVHYEIRVDPRGENRFVNTEILKL